MIQDWTVWLGLFLFVVVLLYAYLAWLFSLARRKDDRKDLFFLLLYAPYIVSIVGLLLFVFSGMNFGLWGLVLFFAFVVERVVWGVSLYEVAGEGSVAWFLMIYFFSPLLWIVYQLQKLG